MVTIVPTHRLQQVAAGLGMEHYTRLVVKWMREAGIEVTRDGDSIMTTVRDTTQLEQAMAIHEKAMQWSITGRRE